MTASKSGFTIVELLIVIVVIAVLATISAVTFNGVQRRATNTVIISTVNQSIKAISAYIAANGTYPLNGGGNSCLLPSKSSCTASGTSASINATLDTNLKIISQLPASTPDADPNYNGIIYSYNSTRTFNGTLQPVTLFYSIQGDLQQCGLPNVLANGSTTGVPSTNGRTGSSGGYTTCYISIAGP